MGNDFSVCSLGWFLMGMGCFDLDRTWVDSHGSGLVLISLFFGWFLMDLGFDFSVIWVWVLNFSVLYVGHLSAIILHDQSRFNIRNFSSFQDIFCQLDPNYYVYLLMPNKVSLAAIPVNWLKNFEGQLRQYLFIFFFFLSLYCFFSCIYSYKRRCSFLLCCISINLLIAFDRGELATIHGEIKPKTLHCVLR